MIFDQLVWMNDPTPRDGPLNMAIDETLLAAFNASGTAAQPILRVYRWSGPWVSVGYFEPLEAARRAFPGRKLVRRWTGGGIVPHGEDLTYSLLVPRSHLPRTWRAQAAYNDIHKIIAVTLQAVGFENVTLSGEGDTGRGAVSHECFGNPVRHDVMLDGHKVAGAAQRRTRGGLLHQGSIQGPHEPRAGNPHFGPGSALHSAVCAHLPLALARRADPWQLSTEELERAQSLAAMRYAVTSWIDKF